MTTAEWVTIICALLGGGGVYGGARGIATLTRLAVAAEQAGPAIIKVGEALAAVGDQVQGHETQLAVQATTIAAHASQIATLAAAQQAAPVPTSPNGNVT